MNEMILQNEVQCLNCNDIVWSGSRHDFKSCKCGAVSVDGGQEYIRRVYDSKIAPDYCVRERSLTLKDKDAFAQLVKIVAFLMKNVVDEKTLALLTLLFFHRDHEAFDWKYQPRGFKTACLKEIKKMKDSGRNAFGVVLGIVRVLREYRMLDATMFEQSEETVNPEPANE